MSDIFPKGAGKLVALVFFGNVALFVGAVAAIAVAVKWVIS